MHRYNWGCLRIVCLRIFVSALGTKIMSTRAQGILGLMKGRKTCDAHPQLLSMVYFTPKGSYPYPFPCPSCVLHLPLFLSPAIPCMHADVCHGRCGWTGCLVQRLAAGAARQRICARPCRCHDAPVPKRGVWVFTQVRQLHASLHIALRPADQAGSSDQRRLRSALPVADLGVTHRCIPTNPHQQCICGKRWI